MGGRPRGWTRGLARRSMSCVRLGWMTSRGTACCGTTLGRPYSGRGNARAAGRGRTRRPRGWRDGLRGDPGRDRGLRRGGVRRGGQRAGKRRASGRGRPGGAAGAGAGGGHEAGARHGKAGNRNLRQDAIHPTAVGRRAGAGGALEAGARHGKGGNRNLRQDATHPTAVGRRAGAGGARGRGTPWKGGKPKSPTGRHTPYSRRATRRRVPAGVGESRRGMSKNSDVAPC